MTAPLETYLSEMREIRASGVATDETSYYAPLQTLLNELGRGLAPKVSCVSQPKDAGAGRPDFYLYTAPQFRKSGTLRKPVPDMPPERGVVEAKPSGDDAWATAESRQVIDYWQRYGLVLVTNYRDFLLLGADRRGERAILETFRLADSEEAFWSLAAHPRAAAKALNTRFVEFLTRVLLHRAPLAQPKDVAWFLASYARDALARVEAAGDLPALAAVRGSLEEALGLKFEGEKGEHFFRSTLVQTLFYGVFSAWVTWCRQQAPGGREGFDWHAAAWTLHVPMVRTLFTAVATPERLGPLGLVEVLDWTAVALNRVDRAAFFARFQEERAVQYFYEPFLEAFDPDLRKQLGVWYTPPEVVQYMVARVDAVLRSELGLPDGLADENVYVLDPCCGTGSYLVEALRRIAGTLKAKGDSALLGHDVKRAATGRVFGFEIMPAPYVIAHWQVGTLLQSLGAPFDDERDERAGIYLTNALTGWEPPAGPKKQLTFLPELDEEREAAAHVKRDTPILVILGNPPYNAFAGTSPEEEGGLVEVYKEGLIREWGIKKFNLDELYVRFFRIAERRIAEQTGRGIVSFISNYSWVSEPSFVVLRQHLLANFDRFWIENMHGNRRNSEYAPDGRTSETIFAAAGFSPGIRQGIVVSLWVKRGGAGGDKRVLFRDDINEARAVDRRAQLLDSINAPDFDARYRAADPKPDNRYSFRPQVVAAHYLDWPRLTELCALPPMNGLMEKRGGALIDIERTTLERRMRRYYDRALDWDEIRSSPSGLTRNAARFDAKKTRTKVLAAEAFEEGHLRRYLVRPFDTRWCYYAPVRPLWNEPRPALWAQCWEGNQFFVSRLRTSTDREGVPAFFTAFLSDDHLIVPDASCFPIRLRNGRRLKKRALAGMADLFGHEIAEEETVANLSKGCRAYLASLGMADPDADAATAALIWMHALAIGYSPAYLTENADGVRQDWPRVPLPAARERLEASAVLGRQVAALLDTEAPVEGVTAGALRPELRAVGAASRVGGGALKPREFRVTAGWGHAGKGGVTMPGKGKVVERDYTTEERAAIAGGAAALGLTQAEAFACLGENTRDVYLNDAAYWANVPAKAWAYTIGGYQVMKKWLSYREYDLLGRPLSGDEVREVANMARRIAAILLLQPSLDANYRAAVAHPYAWPAHRSTSCLS